METMRWDKLMDFYLGYQRANWSRSYDAKRDGWRSSEFGYCARRMTLKRAGVPITETIDEKKRRTFAYGDLVHRFAKGIFWRLGLMLADEVPLVSADGTLTGHIDCIVGGPPRPVDAEPEEVLARWSPEYREFTAGLRRAVSEEFGDLLDEVTGVEMKSSHSFAMRKLHSEGPYRFHVGQLASYALMIRQNPDQLERWDEPEEAPIPRPERYRLLYVGKDSTGCLQFDLPGGSIDHAEAKLEMLNRCWEAQELPPCTCSEKERSWCAYATKDGCCQVDDWDRIGELLAASLDAVATP